METRRMLKAGLAIALIGQATVVGHVAQASSPPIVVIVMENHEYGSVIGNRSAPYINRTLVPDGLLATNYHAVFHPSLPNYLAMTSGSNDGCTSDSCARRSIAADSLFHQLGSDWRAYEESMPSACDV